MKHSDAWSTTISYKKIQHTDFVRNVKNVNSMTV